MQLVGGREGVGGRLESGQRVDGRLLFDLHKKVQKGWIAGKQDSLGFDVHRLAPRSLPANQRCFGSHSRRKSSSCVRFVLI